MKRSPMKRSAPLRNNTQAVTKVNTKTCAKAKGGCGAKFIPARPMQCACSPLCAQAFSALASAKKAAKAAADDRRKTRAQLEAAKPRSKWLAECQAIVNKIVRIRDRDLPCCSCDRPAWWDGQWHASHLRSVGAASAVRFNLWNVHKGCSICNNHLSGNLAGYLPRIRERIGNQKVDWLYQQNHRVTYDIEYLKRFKAVMGRRLKRLEKRYAM